jgi:hypothetical protein
MRAWSVKYWIEEQELVHERTSVGATGARCGFVLISNTGDHA